MTSVLERLRAESQAAGSSSPYQCFCARPLGKGHRVNGGPGYTCDPSSIHWEDPQVVERQEAIAALEGVLAKLSESQGPRDAIALASKTLRERIAALKKDIGEAQKVANAAQKFDPKIEAAAAKAAAA